MKCALTIGNFDGVHLGHQELIRSVLEIAAAQALPAKLLTFEPHPREFLGIRPIPARICGAAEKCRRITSLGLSNIIVQDFNESFSNLTPAEFLDWLALNFDPACVVIGKNFYFGKNRAGNPEFLRDWGKHANVAIEVLKPVSREGLVVSSSEVRGLIQAGEIKKANALMDFPHRLELDVVGGEKRGRELGFPTLNSPIPRAVGIAHFCLPPHGVYVTRTLADGRAFASVTNFGIRPTFHPGSHEEVFETHLLTPVDRLSSKHLSVDFLDRIRPELRFSTKEQLIQRIQLDIAIAKSFHQL